MYKKSMATALLVCSIPAVASASWFLSTQVKSGGGSLTTRNMAGQTVTDLAVYQSYTAAKGVLAVSATPADGFVLQSLTVNGVTLQNPGTVAVTGTDKNIAAVFSPVGFKVTATGTPSAVGSLFYGYELKSPLTFSFTPAPGKAITAINGVIPADAVKNFNPKVITDSKLRKITTSIPGTINAVAKVTLPTGYIFTGGFNLTTTQEAKVASLEAGASHLTVVAGKNWQGVDNAANLSANMTLPAGNTATYSYSWKLVSGPQSTRTLNTAANGDLSSATGSAYDMVAGPALSTMSFTEDNTTGTASFIPTVAGKYKLLLTAHPNDGSGDLYAMTTVNVVAKMKDANANTCQFCHSANNIGGTFNADNTVKQTSYSRIFANWSGSVHKSVNCATCHAGAETGGHPGTIQCADCHHADAATERPDAPTTKAAAVDCAHCHAADGNIHNVLKAAVNVVKTNESCISCHDVAAPNHSGFNSGAPANLVNDNNGVRAVVGEFQKWSHHVTGVALNDAHCAACHLEGKTNATGDAIVIDRTKHMVDAQTHLRNADTDADFAWDPMAPNHTGMDNFCMSCHDGGATTAGATSTESAKIQALINAPGKYNTGRTATATNPFGDTISNRYDKMMRPAVTNVNDQFNTGNNSHHAVKGPRYTGRTRVAGPRSIDSVAFAQNSSATLQGIRSTIYDAGNFTAVYTPLENAGGELAPRTGANSLGDDSTLHCGDCHTVGQWKPGTAQYIKTDGSVDTSKVSPAIGAHGSNNEYMLRNSLGTDERHTQNAYVVDAYNVVTATNPNGAFLVCYNCHAYKNYGSVYVGTGIDGGTVAGTELGNVQPHAGEYASGGRCNGPGNTLSFVGYTTGTGADGTRFESRLDGNGGYNLSLGEQSPDFGNAFGIQCLNCHNSGIGNAYGGIHGSANDTSWNDGTTTITPAALLSSAGKTAEGNGYYIDGMGNAQKVERFLPGLGNAMHVPGTLGGIAGGTAGKFINRSTASNGIYTTGGVSDDTNWEQKHWQQKANSIFVYTQTAVQKGTSTKNLASAGAGCYTLGETTDVSKTAAAGLRGPSVTGPTGGETEAVGTWGGCDDHSAAQGRGDHGFMKRIVRPVTY